MQAVSAPSAISLAAPKANTNTKMMTDKDVQWASEMLGDQSITDMLINLADCAREWKHISDGQPFWPDNVNIITLLLRTRRFNQAIAMTTTPDAADQARMTGEIASALKQLLKMYTDLEGERDSHEDYSKEGHARLNNLTFGNRHAEPMSPEYYGTENLCIGIAGNAYLLGLCGEPQHLRALLPVANPVDEHMGYPVKLAAVDAMDRILVRASTGHAMPEAPRAVLTEYMAWRKERRLNERPAASSFSYDSPGTPFSLAGTVGGLPTEGIGSIELPYAPACYTGGVQVLSTELMDNPAKRQEYNTFMETHNSPHEMITERPEQGLTVDDTKYIIEKAERVLEALQ